MGDNEWARSARPDGTGHGLEAAEVDDSAAAPHEFWSSMWDNVLAQPGALLGAVAATAVSVAVMVGAGQPTSEAMSAGNEGDVGRGTGTLVSSALVPVPDPYPPVEAPAAERPREAQPAASRQERYRALAEDAAKTCPGLPAGVLFAISAVESDHGRNRRVSRAGARGPMQFLPGTWRAYAVDGDGDGHRDITNAADAVHTAARHLCLNGGADPEGLRHAIWNYNHSKSYVERVLDVARAY